MTEVTKYSDEQIDAKLRELKSLGVRYALGAYVDIHGVPKAKYVRLTTFLIWCAALNCSRVMLWTV